MTTNEEEKFATLIAKARQKRDRLQRELGEIQDWLNKFDDFIDQANRLFEDESNRIVSYTSEIKHTRKRPYLREKTKPEKIREILETSGQPMKVRQIYNEFVKKFGEIPGKYGPTIIRNTLGKKPIWFAQNIEDKTWYLKDKNYPKKQIDSHLFLGETDAIQP